MADITIAHRFAAPPAVARGAEFVDDWWRMALGSLSAYLGGDDGIMRPYFSDPAPRVEFSIFIHAPRDSVFATLIESENLNR